MVVRRLIKGKSMERETDRNRPSMPTHPPTHGSAFVRTWHPCDESEGRDHRVGGQHAPRLDAAAVLDDAARGLFSLVVRRLRMEEGTVPGF